MLKGILLAASTAVLIATSFIGASVVTSTTAEAKRGFGCQINPSKCQNQLSTPNTFGNRGNRKSGAKKKGKGKRR